MINDTKKMINAIFAMDLTGGIGYKNALPWGHNALDLAHFKKTTDGHTVIMGRNTWNSLPKSFRPLPNRINIVVSSTDDIDEEGVIVMNFESVKTFIESYGEGSDKELFVIGGKILLESLIQYVGLLHVTEISGRYMSDVVINKDIIFKDMFKTSGREEGKCIFSKYSRTYPTQEAEELEQKPINFGSTLGLNKKI